MDELASELTNRELNGWQQYFSEEPFGQTHLDYLVANLTAVVANAVRDMDEHPEPFKPDDFIPKYARESDQLKPEPPPSWENDVAWVNAMVEAGMIHRTVQ